MKTEKSKSPKYLTPENLYDTAAGKFLKKCGITLSEEKVGQAFVISGPRHSDGDNDNDSSGKEKERGKR